MWLSHLSVTEFEEKYILSFSKSYILHIWNHFKLLHWSTNLFTCNKNRKNNITLKSKYICIARQFTLQSYFILRVNIFAQKSVCSFLKKQTVCCSFYVYIWQNMSKFHVTNLRKLQLFIYIFVSILYFCCLIFIFFPLTSALERVF